MIEQGAPHSIIKSFKPLVGKNPRVLILGTMPGPVALKVRQFYGFSGNHFWKIMADLFGQPLDLNYQDREEMLKRNHVALWDVFESCQRVGASDGAIRCAVLNDVPGLVRAHPTLRVIFLNGTTAERIYRKNFETKIPLPALRMPSTSPAHASMSYEKKKKAWGAIKRYLTRIGAGFGGSQSK